MILTLESYQPMKSEKVLMGCFTVVKHTGLFAKYKNTDISYNQYSDN